MPSFEDARALRYHHQYPSVGSSSPTMKTTNSSSDAAAFFAAVNNENNAQRVVSKSHPVLETTGDDKDTAGGDNDTTDGDAICGESADERAAAGCGGGGNHPIPAQFLMLDPSSPQYRCCRGYAHVRTGAIIIGSLEFGALCLLIIITIGDYLSYNSTLWPLIIPLVRLLPTTLMLTVVYRRSTRTYAIIPELVNQGVTVVLCVCYTGYCLYWIWVHLITETRTKWDDLERTIALSTTSTFAFLTLSLALIQAWFMNVVYQAFRFLRDKRAHEGYWSAPVYV